jgi:hypothetical protein
MENTDPPFKGIKIRVAEDQPEYLPITMMEVNHPAYGVVEGHETNMVVLSFKPDQEEIESLQRDGIIYVCLLTFGGEMQPLIVSTKKEEMIDWFGLVPKEGENG